MNNPLPNDPVRTSGERMSQHLNEIARLFKPGVKLTLLVRSPGMPERNAMLTDEDDIEQAIEALRQVFNKPTGRVMDV